MCNVQGSSAAELAASPGRLQAQDKPKSAQRGSQPLRTEWSIAALTSSGPVSTTPRDSDARSMPAPGLPLHEAPGAARKDELAPAAGSSQQGVGASLAECSGEDELAVPLLQGEGHSNHAASTAHVTSSSGKDPLPSSAAQHLSLPQKEHGDDSSREEQGPLEQDVLCSQLPGSSACQTQPPKAATHQLEASLPLPQDPPAGSMRLKPGTLELEGNTESAGWEGGLPSSRQAPVHSPAQHGRHSSRSPDKKPTTSHFSIHVDGRAHVHRYSTAPQARSDSAAANEPTSPQVYLQGKHAWRCTHVCCQSRCTPAGQALHVFPVYKPSCCVNHKLSP